MGATVFLRDVVRETEHAFLITVVPLQRRFYNDAIQLMQSKDLDAFDISKESEETRAGR